jgi:hypothetical protein
MGPTGVDLAPLADLIADLHRENARLTEASTIWQVRAMQAEDRLKQLTAGDEAAQDAASARSDATGTTEGREAGQAAAPWWRFWERRG